MTTTRASKRRTAAGCGSVRDARSVCDLPGSFLQQLTATLSPSSRLALRATCRYFQQHVDQSSSSLTLKLIKRQPSFMLLQHHGLLQHVVNLDTFSASRGVVSIGCRNPATGLAGALPRLQRAQLNNSQASLIDLLVAASPQLSSIKLSISSSTPTVMRSLAGLPKLHNLELQLVHPAYVKGCAGLADLTQLQQLAIVGRPLDESSKHGSGSISSAFWEDCIAVLTQLTSLSVNPWIKAAPEGGEVTYSSLVNLHQLSVPYASGKTRPNGTASMLSQLARHCHSLTSLTVGVHEFGWDVSALSGLSQLRELEIHNPFLKEVWGLQPFTAAHLAPLTAAKQLTSLTISTLRLPSMMDIMQAAGQQQLQQLQPLGFNVGAGAAVAAAAAAAAAGAAVEAIAGGLPGGIAAAGDADMANVAPGDAGGVQVGNNGAAGGAAAPAQAVGLAAAVPPVVPPIAAAAGIPGLNMVNGVVVAALQAAAANPQLLAAPAADNAAAIAAVQAAAAAVAALAAPLAAMLQQQLVLPPAGAGNAADVAAAAQAAAQAAAAAAAEAQAAAAAADPGAAAVQAAVAQAAAAQQVGQALAAAAAAGGAPLPAAQQQQLLAAAIAAVEQAGHAVAAAVAPVVVAAGVFLPAAQQQLPQQQQQLLQAGGGPAAVAANPLAAVAANVVAGPGINLVPVPLVPPPQPPAPQAAAVAAVAAAAAAAAGALLPTLPCLPSLKRLTVGTTHGRLTSGVSLAALAPNLTCFEDLSELMRLPPAGTDILCGLTSLQQLTVNVDTLQQHARHPSLTGFSSLSISGSGGSFRVDDSSSSQQMPSLSPVAAAVLPSSQLPNSSNVAASGAQAASVSGSSNANIDASGAAASATAPIAAAAGSAGPVFSSSDRDLATAAVRWTSLQQLRCLRLLMLGHIHPEVIPGGAALPHLPSITRLELCSAFGGRPEYAETYTIAEDPLLWQEQVGVQELVIDGGALLGGFLVDAGMMRLLKQQLRQLRRLVLCRCPDLTNEHVERAVRARVAPEILVRRDCPLVTEAAVVAMNEAAGGGCRVDLVLVDPADYQGKSFTYAIDE